MAHRSGESLGQEGRYRQTPSSPKGQSSSSVVTAGVRQQHQDRLQQAGDTLRRMATDKDNEYNVGATCK